MTDAARLVSHNLKHRRHVVMDIISSIPLELLVWPVAGYSPAWRFTRLLKLHRYFFFANLCEMRTNSPHAHRIARLMHALTLTIHWYACMFHSISVYEGRGSNEWVMPADALNENIQDLHVDPAFSQLWHRYLYAIYYSSMVLMTIGDMPIPETNVEIAFSVAANFLAIVIFATGTPRTPP